MKKSAYFVIFMFSVILHGFAQNTEQKFSVQVLAGASFATGKFADKSISQDTGSTAAGWAKPGPAIQVALNYKVNKFFGLSLILGGQQNKQDVNSVTNNFAFHTSNPSDSDSYNTSVHDWKIGKILAGGFLNIPLSKNGALNFQPKLMAGVLKTSLPGYSIIIYHITNGVRGGGEPVVYASASLPLAFCYQAEAALGYNIGSKIYLTANLNYFHASPNRDYTAAYFINSTPGYKHYDTKYPISSLNILFGAGVRF